MYKKLFKSIFLYGLASSLGKFIGLFLLPMYVRVFPPAQYGIIDLIQTSITIISIFGMLLLESAIQRFYFELKDDLLRRQYISTAFWTISFFSLLLLLFVSFFSKEISYLLFKDIQYYNSISLAAITIPLSNLFVFSSVIIRFMNKPIIYMVNVLTQILLTITFSIYFVIHLKLGIVGVFYGQVLGLIIALMLSGYYLRYTIKLYWSRTIIRKMFAFSIPIFPAAIGSIGNSYFNRFIMLGYLSLADIGLFTIAAKLTSGFNLIESAVNLAWYPFFYEQLESNKEHKIIFRKISKYLTITIFGLISIFVLYTKDFLILLTTKNYYKAMPIMSILALVSGLTISKITIDLGTLISKKTIYDTYAYLGSAVINIISLFILVPLVGLIGVPISLLVGSFTLLVISWTMSEKLYYIGFKKLPFALSFLGALSIALFTIFVELNLAMKIGITIESLLLLASTFWKSKLIIKY
jgi:O-antigen/teichoic acid export membrane protein